MKDLFAHLQTSMQQDLDSRTDGVALNLTQQLPDQNSNDMTLNGHFQNNRSTWTTSFQTAKSKYSDGPLMNFLSEYKPSCEVIHTMLQELHNERLKIIKDIESEEKERVWFLNQLERLKREEQCLALADNYTTEKEGAYRELQQEGCRLRELKQQKFGSDNDIIRRYNVRSQNLQLIDQEMDKLREQTQKFANSRNNVENGDSKIEDKIPDVNFHKGCISSMSNKSSNMTTSATQTTIDLYPTDCLSSNGHVNGENNLSSFSHGTWPLEKVALWHSGPSTVGEMNSSLLGLANQETSSVMSFTSSVNSSCSARRIHMHQLGTKVEVVYSLLSLLGSHDKDEMSKRLLAMSSSQDSCVAMRQSGCMPLLIQLLYGGDKESSGSDACSNREVRMRASKALHNIVHAHPDDKRGRREARVLRLLEQIRDYCDSLQDNNELEKNDEHNSGAASNMEQHPGPAMAALMKLSFDEEHRHAMCQLGGLQAIAELIEADYAVHGNTNDQHCVTSRRYAGMALTNLTFGDGTNKALLCSFKSFLCALVSQLHSPSEDLRQVVSSVLRNLSWRADPASKKMLREVGAVTTLMKAAMEGKKESTLKSILSALWNLSAHCSINKSDICAVDGALAFLVSTLTYKSSSKTLAIIENGGGILRNISSQIAVREDYRSVLRQHNCLQILLQHLRSSSLTIVSNACGTLWNLSARCVKDQQTLWEMGAVSMLRNLVHSKHKMISMGSSAALKNLLAAKPQGMALATPGTIDGQKTNVPSLLVRKQRALEAEIDQNLAETCDNIDSPKSSPTHRIDSRYSLPDNGHHHNRLQCSIDGQSGLKFAARSASKDSVGSAHSDLVLSQMDDGEFRIHKEENQCSGWKQEPSDGYYKAGLTCQESSRIAQVMKEVVRQVALEDGLTNSLDRKFIGPNDDKNLLSYNSILPSQLGVGNASPQAGSHGIYDKYSDFSSKYNNRNSNDFSCQEEREKCSFKYADNDKKIDNCDKLHKDKNQVEVLNKQQNKLTNRHWQGINERCHKTESDDGKLFSTYNETDSEDQPTNYSLRYHEENDDLDNYRPPEPKPVYYPNSFGDKNPSVHDDTLTTYCMEGTPLNFSNATSMSDLRDVREKSSVEKTLKSDCNYADNDKPVSYCVEGTPVCFSRVSSLSSILSGDKEIEIGEDDTKDNSKHEKPVCAEKPIRVQNDCKEVKEVKSVSFGEGNVAEETPLMFSRCSSLGSLSSFDQHSIHDDRSSVVSDFSRRASGALSPSDLPDSPSQTMPCSPKRTKDNIDFSKSNSEQKRSNCDPFSDTLRAYATEDTPNGFSTATSLSSLMIDDEKSNDQVEKINVGKSSRENHLQQELNLPADDESPGNKNVFEGEENEEEMLAACINSGMPNNSNQRKYNNSKLLSKVNKISGIPRAKTSGIPVKANNVRDVRSPINAVASNLSTATYKPMNDARENKDNNSKAKGDCYNSLEVECDNSEELMLAECIQSGMPKNRMQRNDISYDPAGGDRVRNPVSPSRMVHRLRPSAPVNRSVATKNMNGFISCSSDSVVIYAEEGTPRNISGFSSLSDLTIDSMADKPKGKVDRKPPKPVEYVYAASDSLHNYAEEGTPGIISRQDSLSSLSVIDDETGQERRAHKDNMLYRISGKYNIGTNSARNHSAEPSNLSNSADRTVFQDYGRNYLVENTPMCFSNNSPLSALSIESICEPSADEQALLDECISSGMPKNRNSVLEKKKRKNHVDGRCKEEKK
uniref:Adenomatous polyposis coli protein n=1 Tax=Strigamia maritima TaxID=126957 RepID=T1J0P6_STRMM